MPWAFFCHEKSNRTNLQIFYFYPPHHHHHRLVVPAKFNELTKDKRTAIVLDREISKLKQRYNVCLEVIHQEKITSYICFLFIIINLIFINCIFSRNKKENDSQTRIILFIPRIPDKFSIF